MSASSMNALVSRLAQVIAVLLLAGCGGGGGNAGGGAAAANRPPPITRTTEPFQLRYGVSVVTYPGCPRGLDKGDSGYITFERVGILPPCIEAGTLVTLDGQPFDAGSIPDGSVALVRGLRTLTNEPGVPRETSVVTAIDLQRAVVGTIESVDLAHARFSVLGQQIYLSSLTKIFGNGTTDALTVGKRVAVSGFFSPTGEVVATAITDDALGQGFVLRGILQIDVLGAVRVGRLLIGSVHDDVFEEFPEDPGAPGQTGPVLDGSPVLVLADAPPFNGALAPHSVRYIGGELGAGPEAFRYFEGMVSRSSSPLEIEVEGRPVDCAFYHCWEARIGLLVGVIRGASGLDPRNQVALLVPGFRSVAIAGPVGAVDVQNSSLSVIGFPIQVLPATTLYDHSDLPLRGIADIEIGDNVLVGGGPVGNLLVASTIDRHGGTNLQISTRVADYADPAIHVLGRTILTNSTTAVFEDCVGRRDQRWLFRVAGSIAELRMEVSQTGGEFFATRVDVNTNVCEGS